MAAAYAFHISKNHPFLDGNKRAAIAAMIAFLSDNGWSFDAIADAAEPMIVQLATGSIDKAAFTDWAKAQMHAKPKMELREFFALLNYQAVVEFFESGMVHDNPDLARKERFDTVMEAARAIPAIHEANLGATSAEHAGNKESATILRAQSLLLTALYRIAQDMGYEW
jgi:Fic/DOC family